MRLLAASGARPAVPERPQTASDPASRHALEAELASLRALETELASEWQRLQEDGYGYAAVQSALCEGKSAAGDVAVDLAQVDAAQRAFLERLDDFQRRAQSHFMDTVVTELESALEVITGFYGKRRIRGIARAERRLRQLAAQYRELEHAYGTPRDHKRIQVCQRFYAGVLGFSERIRRLDPTMPTPASPSWAQRWRALRRFATGAARRSWRALLVGVAFLHALAVVLRREQPERGTPFTRRVDGLFRAWGRWLELDVEVSGRPHVTAPTQSDGAAAPVTIYAPAHRHGLTDNITAAHLGLGDYLVFNAVDQVPGLPRWLANRMAATNGLIAVGAGRGSSLDRALDALRQRVARNVLIYPEGSVSEGFRGTRPPRTNFGEGLVRRIRDAGEPLRIVPIAYLDNARFLDLPPRSDTPADRLRRVAVAPPLEAEAIDALLAAGGGEMLNRMVRLAWLENLVTDRDHLLGHDRVHAIERRLGRELDGIRYWGSLESAPVSDLLPIDSPDPIEVREEPFRGKRVRVLRLPESARDDTGRTPIESLADPASNELLIGLRPPSHIYLSVGPRRFDGDIFRKLKVKERDTIHPGIVIRFMGVPIKSLNAIRRNLDEYAGREVRTLTCANSACRLIARAANIKIDDHADLRPFLPSHVLPTRTIRKLIERGVRNHAGGSVDVQIYKTDDRSLEAILAEARRQELRIARDHLQMATVGLWNAVVRRAKPTR